MNKYKLPEIVYLQKFPKSPVVHVQTLLAELLQDQKKSTNKGVRISIKEKGEKRNNQILDSTRC